MMQNRDLANYLQTSGLENTELEFNSKECIWENCLENDFIEGVKIGAGLVVEDFFVLVTETDTDKTE